MDVTGDVQLTYEIQKAVADLFKASAAWIPWKWIVHPILKHKKIHFQAFQEIFFNDFVHAERIYMSL